MTERRGSDHWRSGPRLPRKLKPLPAEHDELADPAHGAIVPRCWNCGRPGIGRTIHPYSLYDGHRFMGRWQLCGDCLVERNPRPNPDPLDVSMTA